MFLLFLLSTTVSLNDPPHILHADRVHRVDTKSYLRSDPDLPRSVRNHLKMVFRLAGNVKYFPWCGFAVFTNGYSVIHFHQFLFIIQYFVVFCNMVLHDKQKY